MNEQGLIDALTVIMWAIAVAFWVAVLIGVGAAIYAAFIAIHDIVTEYLEERKNKTKQ